MQGHIKTSGGLELRTCAKNMKVVVSPSPLGKKAVSSPEFFLIFGNRYFGAFSGPSDEHTIDKNF